MNVESINTPDDLEAMPFGTMFGSSIGYYVRSSNGWCSLILEEFYPSSQLFNYLPVGMVPGTRQVQVYFRPDK